MVTKIGKKERKKERFWVRDDFLELASSGLSNCLLISLEIIYQSTKRCSQVSVDSSRK